jgi:hypothetical protein
MAAHWWPASAVSPTIKETNGTIDELVNDKTENSIGLQLWRQGGTAHIEATDWHV